MVRRHTDGQPYIGAVSANQHWALYIHWLDMSRPTTILTFESETALFLYLEDMDMSHLMGYSVSRAIQ